MSNTNYSHPLRKRRGKTTLWVDKETRLRLEEVKRTYKLRSLDAAIRRLMANTEELRELKKKIGGEKAFY
jgi:hypothetical protein